MVKFGRHLQFFLENEHQGSRLYVVPYNELRQLVKSPNFSYEWAHCFQQACNDFQRALRDMWSIVFDRLADNEASRGALPNEALTIYVTSLRHDEAQELLRCLKDIQSTATVNAEALRKSVKKHDKVAIKERLNVLSPMLLPELYAANFTIGLPNIDASLELVRERLSLDIPDTEDESDDHPKRKWKQETGDVTKRKAEMKWLQSMVSSLSQSEIQHLVAHRGFHSPKDKYNRRPLENSLDAYEACWNNGVHLCECDIVLTKDEKLVLAHDEDFSRLALDPTSQSSTTKVSDLTFKELIALPLKSGSRPPLLIDVLRSAEAIGGKSQLVIEVKPGNSEVGPALVRMFQRHPNLMKCCAVIMSFDAFAMHDIRRELASFDDPVHGSKYGMNYKQLGDPMQEVGSPQSQSYMDSHVLHPLNSRNTYTKPKLLLVTVAEPAQVPCELWVDVEDLSPVEGWLSADDGCLDGVYLQFQEQMLTPKGLRCLQNIASRYHIGVWLISSRDPDDWETFHRLVHDGHVSYVNSSLPRKFVKSTMRDQSPIVEPLEGISPPGSPNNFELDM